jgi:hypothetical protein
MGLDQIKKLLHIKENNYQNEETVDKMRENVCQVVRQEINIQNI